ncbi:MAG: hypothetical protein GXO48_06640 [Chlorobi bacterium]|nr:hypothetical protein [Chlorobiota bacterium]
MVSSGALAQTVTNPVTYKRYASIVQFSPVGASSVGIIPNQAGLSNPFIGATLPYQRWAGADLTVQLSRYGVQGQDAGNVIVDAGPTELNLFLPVHKKITIGAGINPYFNNEGRYVSSENSGLWSLSSYGGLLQARLFAGLSVVDRKGWKVGLGTGTFFLTGIMIDTFKRKATYNQTLMRIIMTKQTVRDLGLHASFLVSKRLSTFSISLATGINHNPTVNASVEEYQWLAVKWKPTSITDTVLKTKFLADTVLNGVSEFFMGVGFATDQFQTEVLIASMFPQPFFGSRVSISWFPEPGKDLPVKKAFSVAATYQRGTLVSGDFQDIGIELAYSIPGVGTAGTLTVRTGVNRWRTTQLSAIYWHVAATVALRERWFIRRKFE